MEDLCGGADELRARGEQPWMDYAARAPASWRGVVPSMGASTHGGGGPVPRWRRGCRVREATTRGRGGAVEGLLSVWWRRERRARAGEGERWRRGAWEEMGGGREREGDGGGEESGAGERRG